jgi:hypothetical protein
MILLNTSIYFLPCGCIVDPMQLQQGMPIDRVTLWCPWCDASFDADELRQWVKGGHKNPTVSPVMPLALCDNEQIVEIVGACGDCEHPLVRELQERGKAHHCHIARLQPMPN